MFYQILLKKKYNIFRTGGNKNMNKIIVRSTNLEALKKIGTIEYKANFLNLIFINTELTLEEVKQIDGVTSAENDDLFDALCG
jgi:hypothetical protein